MKKIMLWMLMTMFIVSPLYAGGSISGSAKFSGTAPEMGKIAMNADPTCAALHAEQAKEETVIVNANGTLKNVFVYVKEGLEGKTFPAPTELVSINQRGCQYDPHVFGIQVGQPLQIINSDNTLHNVHSLAEKSKQFNLGMPIQGMKLTKKFETPEIMVKFKCDVHPWMNAYIGVLTHPFYGVTNDTGDFEIKDLPPGEYTLEAWHEKYGAQIQKVTVAEGAPAAVEFTFNG